MKINQDAISKLPSAPKGWVEAYLIEYSTDLSVEERLWTFFYNPQMLRFSGDAKYNETGTFAAREQNQQFGYSSGLTLEVPRLYLDSYCLGKSLRPLLEGLDELRKADVKKSKFNPPILSFIWGSRRFSPCVLTRISWDESAWLSGEPARVQMSLTFLQVPKPGALGAKMTTTTFDADKKALEGKPRQELTDRQRQDASTKAREWLAANQQTLDSTTQNLVRSNRYKLLTDAKTGDVTMLDLKGQKVGTVGRWDGKTFTDQVSTLPKK